MEQFEEIEAYLKNTLSVEEKIRFEEKMNTNSILLEEVELQKKLRLGFQAMAIEKQLYEAQKRFNNEFVVIPQKKLFFTSWLAAASVIVIVGFGLFYKQQYYIPGDVKLIVNDEITYKNLPISFPNGMSLDEKNKLLQQKVQYFLALSYIQKGEKQKAKKILKLIVSDNAHRYYQKANFLLKKM
ncbi:MAG: hypothetical protein IPQ23_02590 [Cytophagaceae bacterium]|nr:hypothetical protein [Cytophagaceae bacterium]